MKQRTTLRFSIFDPRRRHSGTSFRFTFCRVALLVCAAWLLYGCGGASSLTGGSIPIGLSRVAGVVTRADNTGTKLAGAPVRLDMLQLSGVQTTDQNGVFDFSRIGAGKYTCVIQPPTGSGLGYGWDWDFTLANSDTVLVVARLWPDTFDVHSVGSVNLGQGDMTIHVGDTVQFLPSALDKNGAPIALVPSLLLDGDIGTLAADGTFHATKVGSGKIAGWMGIYSTAANITVLP